MKKNYETLWLSVTTFDTEDVITASIESTSEFWVGVDAKETWWKTD